MASLASERKKLRGYPNKGGINPSPEIRMLNMSYADPQTVTINAVAQTLPRISSGANAGVFQKDDTTVKLSVSHQYGNRTRRTLRLDFSKIAADPLMASVNVRLGMSAYLVVDVPTTGFTIAETKQIVDALTAYLTASSGAKVTQLLGGEN
jgi:hypothetical protein